jgi:RHS repeat-associated protein
MLSFLIKKLQAAASLLSTRTLLLLAIVLSGVTTVLAQDENIYHVHNDHIGRPIMLTDESQRVVWKAHYTPYGEAILEIEEIGFPIRGPGEYYDKESGLHHNYYRDLNTRRGSYEQADPRGQLLDFSDPQRQVAARMGIEIPSPEKICR